MGVWIDGWVFVGSGAWDLEELTLALDELKKDWNPHPKKGG
jgi:hypothetical protein